jgi:hypothetical protein
MHAKKLIAGLMAGGLIALGAAASTDAAASGDAAASAADEKPAAGAAVRQESAPAGTVLQRFRFQPGAVYGLPDRDRDGGRGGRDGDGRRDDRHDDRQQPHGGRFFGGYGLWWPFGAYQYGPTIGQAPQPYWPPILYGERNRRLLIVVEPTDAPGATYYYDSFPSYYGQPGYFPGGAFAGPGVTIVSPAMPQAAAEPPGEQPPAEQEPAAQRQQLPGELEKAGFLSALSPMLGGKSRVSLDFAVGELKLHQGDYAGAADALRRAVGAAPDDAAPKLALGLALTASGDYEGAAQLLRRGLRGTADWRALKLAPQRAFGGDAAYQQVLTGLQAADKANKDAHFVLGFLYTASGRYADAVKELMQGDRNDDVVLALLSEAKHRQEAAQNAPAPAEPAPQGNAG